MTFNSLSNSRSIQGGEEVIKYRKPSSLFLMLTCIAAIAQAQSDQPTSPTIDLAFVGDIMLADTPGVRISRGEDPFRDFAEVFRKVDLLVVFAWDKLSKYSWFL